MSSPATTDLFADSSGVSWRPLADRMRPRSLDEFFGQTHLLGQDKPLRQTIEKQAPHSMIFWGPPGTGKTTLARLVAQQSRASFLALSAVLAGVKEIRTAIDRAQQAKAEGRPTVLFVDEVHRFNKSQQDGFLPYVEDGTFTFIGATTENPSFELNNALLSRARVYVLKALTTAELEQVVEQALTDRDRGLGGRGLSLSDRGRSMLVMAADGDARRALNLLEIASDLAEQANEQILSDQLIEEVVSGSSLRRFDKGGEAFYDQVSALHKSVRGSDPDAALYWLTRMLDGGCDPHYIARRLVRMASEDIGNADPRALQLALNAWEVQERLGSPEGELALAQAVAYLASTVKSNAVYTAYKAAMQDARKYGSTEVPLHLRNAPTKLMKELGYGKAYHYAHDEPDAYAAGENYFPEDMPVQEYYHPSDYGFEKKIAERLRYLKSLHEQHEKKEDNDS